LAEKTYIIRNRHIGEKDLHHIRRTISQHWDKGRSAISRILCEQWNWRQPNGLLKDRACRVMLLSLEEKGEITLPPRLSVIYKGRKHADRRQFSYDNSEIQGKVSELGSLTIRMVRRSPDEGLWDFLVDKYHYLGRPWIVGSYLKYLAYLNGRLVACLGWGSAAWKVACRDQFIGWDRDTKQNNLHQVVNNVRFLILPWVRVEHLASKVLALNIRTLQTDWEDFYRHPIRLLETFVDTTRFRGTCYKASNWIHAGLTKGRGKYDRYNRREQPVKAVYLYPLSRRFREALHAG
jgi:hypothetical protein